MSTSDDERDANTIQPVISKNIIHFDDIFQTTQFQSHKLAW